MTQHQHPFHYYRSPAEIRDVQFTHRIRGVDEYEVAEYLDLLADQVQASDLEIERLREQNRHLEEENARLRERDDQLSGGPSAVSSPAATPQAAALLLNAQRAADALVEEAVRRVQEMLAVARAEKNAILRNAQESAAAMLIEARDAKAPRDALAGGQRTWQLDRQAAR